MWVRPLRSGPSSMSTSSRRCPRRARHRRPRKSEPQTLARYPALGRTAHHVRALAELMNGRQGRHLDQWITKVQADDLPALRTFVTGLGQDLDAVVAGLSLRYSSGAVEGQNNKIKMLKRQMFGRANFDLLRKRVLHTARGRS